MTYSTESDHIYRRIASGGDVDSLSVIASLIEPDKTLLDIGIGAGGLAQKLSSHQNVVVDGVTLNEAEVEVARKWYRRALVADLDRTQLNSLFGDQLYDYIVCADVIEHLKFPDRILAECKQRLGSGGRLIASVPNVGYCGLMAELVQGEFRYRSEGLLDKTHLRFFTRKSLIRFFSDQGWTLLKIMAIDRNLLDSEFRIAFDSLPPSVAQHLLTVPDAMTYQFICVLSPEESPSFGSDQSAQPSTDSEEITTTVKAQFSAALYLAVEHKYSENQKILAAGNIGQARQTLCFQIRPTLTGFTELRFDPADRPGYFRLYKIRISLDSGETVWQWDAKFDSVSVLSSAPHHDLLLTPHWELSDGVLLLLHGNDPWFVLPLGDSVMRVISKHGAKLEVDAGWPMSADYLQASASISHIQASHQHSLHAIDQHVRNLNRKILKEEDHRKQLEAQIQFLGKEAILSRRQQEQSLDKLRASEARCQLLEQKLKHIID